MNIVKFAFSLFGINTYVTVEPATKKCAVIDPGMMEKEEEEAMTRFIERNGLEVTHIINTHLHVDHAVGVKFVKEKWGAPLLAHKADEFLGERLLQQARMFGLGAKVEPVAIDSYLEDNEIINIGEGELKVLCVPGHSPGSIALYDKGGGYVITGDALFAGSVGRTDLEGGDTATLLRSIRERLMTLPDSTAVYPGHGPATTIGREKASNPFL